MITTIAKQFTFDAAHHLPTVPEDHKCRRMHGHTYGVELRFRGSTMPNGFCGGIDYADIATIWAPIHDTLDHRVLNDVPGLEVPSTEHLVEWIVRRWYDECLKLNRLDLKMFLHSVRVSESSTTWCEVYAGDVR